MQKLESQLNKGTEKNDYYKIEYDRMRSLRVDDAMLIDQLRT